MLSSELPSFEQHVDVVEAETSGPLVAPFLRGAPRFATFVGVSIKNRMSNKRRLALLIPWALQRSGSLSIVVGDYIHRFNYMAVEGLPPADAAQKAFSSGKRALRAARSILSEARAEDRAVVLSSLDLTGTIECQAIYKDVLRYYDRNATFVSDVTEEVSSFLSRTCQDHDITTGGRLEVLKSYVLEEIAMFLHLYNTGHLVEIYPGPDLAIMRNIAAGHYDDFPFQCPHRTHVSVCVSPPMT